MKVSLNIQMGQHLTMTPQLQQAIRLLQLSTLELQQEIQNVLDSNPLLEVSEEHETRSKEVENTKQEESRQDDYETELSNSTIEINTNQEMQRITIKSIAINNHRINFFKILIIQISKLNSFS